ncbi:unnamed protein product [Meganyctiphanes norvegica]|uniref:Uncharacterized protein n=1 Tax=Meganyctiphanes norvegica TaxID=48144 RepID=A0AAV2QIK6_MEGNR
MQSSIRKEQYGTVQFLARLGKTPSETHKLLTTAYQDDALRKATTRTVHKRFQTLGMGVYNYTPKQRKSISKRRRLTCSSLHFCDDKDSKCFKNFEKKEILNNSDSMHENTQNDPLESYNDYENAINDRENVMFIKNIPEAHKPQQFSDVNTNQTKCNDCWTNNEEKEVQHKINNDSHLNHNKSRVSENKENNQNENTYMEVNTLYVNILGKFWKLKNYHRY